MDLIKKYFSDLSDQQYQRLEALLPLYTELNEQINVISRKDIEFLFLKHVLHSLSIAKVIQFLPQARILDVGTGGGFPGIPLAIVFPHSQFHLVDSIGKKIKVVQSVKDALDLKNVVAEKCRAEDLKASYDFVVSRAVTAFPVFFQWINKSIASKSLHAIPNGILYLKGGDLSEEFADFKNCYLEASIQSFFEEDFFETKKIVYVTKNKLKLDGKIIKLGSSPIIGN